MTMTDQINNPQPAFVDDIALQIADRAVTAINTAAGASYLIPATMASHVREACAAAYAAGREHSDAEGALVQDAVDQINDARVGRLLESAVASTMEATGTHTLHLDLRHSASVFERQGLTVEHIDGTVVYTLTPRETNTQ